MEPRDPRDDFRRLHDATLRSLSLDWSSGALTLELSLSEEPIVAARLVAEGVRQLVCPRHQPWGRSKSINSVAGPSPSVEGVSTLTIEMQSGDVLEVQAASFVLER